MKRYTLLFLSILALFFDGCKKAEVENLFEKDATTRALEAVADYKTKLITPQYGWKATYYPNNAQNGGYIFYLKFDNAGKVAMYSDLTLDNATTAEQTTYQVKAIETPSLVFDSYAPLHLLADPNPDSYGGNEGQGYLSDLTFTFKTASADVIELVGSKFQSQLKLTPLSKTEADLVNNKGLFTSIDNYFTKTKFSVLTLATGEKMDLDIDVNTKIFTAFFLNKGQLNGVQSAFYFTPTGIQLKEPVSLNGNSFQELIWDNAKNSYYVTINGKRVDIVQANFPSLPFITALGTLYSAILFDPSIPTQDANYIKLYDTIKTQIATLSTTPPIRELMFIAMVFNSDGTVELIFRYNRSTSVFDGIIYYEPSLNAKGNIKFTRLGTNGISPIVAAGAKVLTDQLEKDSFSFDYDPANGNYAVLKSVETPTFIMKGALLR